MSVAPEITDGLVKALVDMDGVISISVRRGESVKPPGDVISAAVLNNVTAWAASPWTLAWS